MIEGKTINLRIAEKEDVILLAQWFNNAEFAGDYQHFPEQISTVQFEKRIPNEERCHTEWVDFIIEKKDETKIGWVAHYTSAPNFGWVEIGYAIIPTERNKGYGTETIQILVDYLFLTKDIVRIQAVPNKEDMASKRVLEKAGFKKKGTLCKALSDSKGKWANGYIYSILREEWKTPTTLTTSSQAKE